MSRVFVGQIKNSNIAMAPYKNLLKINIIDSKITKVKSNFFLFFK